MTTSVSPQSPALSPRSWQPSADDHLIYRWCKFEGYKQAEVARMLNISQPTVSRVLQRYERWQAHLKNREGGRLDAQERLRAQRWLAYERNELIVDSCLRIAEEMERSTELSKTTMCRPIDQPLKHTELRTEQRVVDRHGVASRFLRLAHRINMDQLKLCEILAKEGEAPAEPLTDEELAAELAQAALDAAEMAAGRNPTGSGVFGEDEPAIINQDQPPQTPDPLPPDAEEPPAPAAHHSPQQAPTVNTVKKVNNDCILEITTTPTAPCTCTLQPAAEKNSCACIIDSPQPLDAPRQGASDGLGSGNLAPGGAAT